MHPDMKVRKITTTSRPKLVAEQIAEQILSGSIPPLDQLPPERDLAAQFGVSRNAVREAVKILQARGLVEIQQGCGTIVTSDPSLPVRQAYSDAMKGEKDAENKFLEMRIGLETHVAAVAAQRATERNIRKLIQNVTEFEDKIDNLERCAELDISFHQLVAESSQNKLFNLMLAPLAEMLLEYRRRSLKRGDRRKVSAHHKAVVEAIEARDAALASQRMRHHLETAYKEMLEAKE